MKTPKALNKMFEKFLLANYLRHLIDCNIDPDSTACEIEEEYTAYAKKVKESLAYADSLDDIFEAYREFRKGNLKL